MSCGYDDGDPDAPQPMDLDESTYDDDDGYAECPACGKLMHEDAAVCPYCGEWVTSGSPAADRSRGWFWPLMVAVLLGIILVMWHGLGR